MAINEGFRLVQLASWFLACCVSIHATQTLSLPLYLLNRDWWEAAVAYTKQQFGLVAITVTQWFSPTTVRVSGDASIRGQLRKTAHGGLETDFPERIVLMVNHQIYTEWLYLWWVAYASRMHGAIYIILKQSLQYIPVLGPAMMAFGFIFLSRHWDEDRPRLRYRLQKLCQTHCPIWLLIFPEGTNLSANTRKRSVAWAKKRGLADFEHVLLPRSTGLLYCLQQLAPSVEWLYDCTIAYEGVGRDKYAQDVFTLRSTFLQGRTPKSVNMHWRRIAVSSVPTHDATAFEEWLRDQWQMKNDLIEHYHQHGAFPSDISPIETTVHLASRLEAAQIFLPLATCGLLARIISKIVHLYRSS